jgi:deoxyribose-phosphate aldolase
VASSFATAAGLAACIDHTLLRPDMTAHDSERVAAEGLARGFRGVCVPPYHLARVVATLKGSAVKPITVVGFPLGSSTIYAKLFEALEGFRLGAEELDVVVNLSALKSRDDDLVRREMSEIMAKTPECGHKFIVEVGLLDEDELSRVCRIANGVKPRFVKTSTGMLAPPVSPTQVRKLRDKLEPAIGLKAAGGIRTLAELEALVEAGADVIGSSSSVSILGEYLAAADARG